MRSLLRPGSPLTLATLLVTTLVVAPTTSPLAAQAASLVYTLGKDTVAVEQWTRTASAVDGEFVQRTGAAVARVQYRIVLGRNGRPTETTITRLQADGTPATTGAARTRIVLGADSATRELTFPDSVQRRAFAAARALPNFPTYAYGPVEVLAALRRRGERVDSVPALGAGGAIGFVGLQPVGGDTVRLAGNAGYPMLMRFDANDRLLSVDGSFTTNKVRATRGTGGLDLAAIARGMRPTGVLSARETVRAGFGPGGMVLVDYGRPQVRERTVWGGTLVPYDSVWRAGANDATHLFTTRTLTLGTLTLAPGSYTLWIQHTRGATFLIVNKQTGQWGTQYDATQDLGRVELPMAPAQGFVEEYTITLRAQGAARGMLELAWADKVGSIAFGVAAR